MLPADTAWNEGGVVGAPLPVTAAPRVAEQTLAHTARVLRSGESALLVLTGKALSERGLVAANRVAHATGCMLRTPTQVGCMARGRGRVPVNRIPYAVDAALKDLAGIAHVVLVGAAAPAAFFAYPGKPSLVIPADAKVHTLAHPHEDLVAALESLADELGAPRDVAIPNPGEAPRVATGRFDPAAFASTLAALLPGQCIVAEDGVTSGRGLFPPTFAAAPHDWLQITGGAIGHGFPCATGAAVGAPGRRIVCLQADGGGMYSLQALWTQARENLDVVTVIFANRMYKILKGELLAVGAKPGPASRDLFDLSRPTLDWLLLARGMGVEGARVETLEDFADVFRAACARRGPFLIEMVI
jgi:acetolactate synthase-1/2/3 large subunit